MKPHSRHSDADPNALHLHLNKMFALHNELVELCELSNEKYSNQIVVFVTGAFVVILFGLFFELKVKRHRKYACLLWTGIIVCCFFFRLYIRFCFGYGNNKYR